MSNTVELRNPDDARKFVTQGLWLQRAVVPAAARVRSALEWSLELAATGVPLPPVGVVADLGHVALHLDRDGRAARDAVAIPDWSATLARTYEDHVLGKVYADRLFERAGDALRRYQGRDRARGVAFIVNRIRERAGFGGVELSPGVLKSLLGTPPEESLARGWDSLNRDGLSPLLVGLYEELIAAARRTGEILGPEDAIQLEHGTALAELGQQVAERQVLQTAARLEAVLPRHRLKPLAGRREVPTHVLDEDAYPVGGFTSISTRGSVESLLHSQLAFMERDERPDLFDIKFLRDELYFYSRDENQFLRRRRTFVIALGPDLVQSRFKDAELPVQRGVMLLSVLLVLVRKLAEWLSTDALVFEVLFVGGNKPALAHEEELLGMLLREQIANGTVTMQHVVDWNAIARHAAEKARRSLCQVLLASVGEVELESDDALVSRLRIDGARPRLALPGEGFQVPDGDEPLESWGAGLERLLMAWV